MIKPDQIKHAITIYDIAFALIGIGVTLEAAYCLIISFQDITKFKDPYKR